MSGRVVIVGAGHGGVNCATFLRRRGFAGEIVLLGAETHVPYHRPPLSKGLLQRELFEPLAAEGFYEEQQVELRLGARAAEIDRDAQVVRLADGQELGYDTLVLATGAAPRRLSVPGVELEGIHELRTLSHALELADVLPPAGRLVIVGGGWIGLEVASSARAAGLEVTVLEREERILARVASAQLSDFLARQHEQAGARIICSANVVAFQAGPDGCGVAAVVLEDGERIAATRVLVGVGAIADDRLARDARLPSADGVIVNERAQTDDPCVYAIGDATRRPLPGREGLFRLESIPSTLEQARQAAAAIVGDDALAPEVPWFWSDQLGMRLRIAGLPTDTERVTIRGEIDSGSFAVAHERLGDLVALECVNAPSEFAAGKREIAAGTFQPLTLD
jgi:3-phenylpropionate/trans-cinnamate dioxygenase ferredoxin reductase component